MTCLLHIRTTTAASPNTKRKERNEDLEEPPQWFIFRFKIKVIIQIMNKLGICLVTIH